MNIPDNTKFERMIQNRPPASILPSVNKRLLSQFKARTIFTTAAFATATAVLLYKFLLNANSKPLLKNRKSFRWESDPYTGQVSCNYRDIPNDQHNY